MNRVGTLVAGLGLSLCLAVPAQAVSIDFGPETQGGNGPDFLFSVNTPDPIVGDAVLTLNMNGDFNGNHEWAEVFIDGIALGIIVNGNTSDDPFNFGNGDAPDPESGSVTPFSGLTVLLNSLIAPLLADGVLEVEVNTNKFVENDLTTISGNLSYETPVVVLPPDTTEEGPTETENPAPVPEPSTLLLFGTGLASLVAWKRKKLA